MLWTSVPRGWALTINLGACNRERNTKYGSDVPALFSRHGVTLFDQRVELLLLLSDPFGCSFFILCARRSSSLFNQLSHIVSKYRDAIVEFR